MVTETLTLEGQSYQTALDYDARSQLTQMLYPSGRTVDYSYTDRRQLNTVTWQGGQIQDRSYDAGGRLTSVDRANVDETRSYDLANRLTSINNPGVGKLDYAWDANGNKLSETWDGVMAPWSFTTEKTGATQYVDGYDEEDRFRRFNRGGQNQDVYLDRTAIGNIFDIDTNGTNVPRSFGLAHELNSVGTSVQVFDAKGNVTNTHSGQSLTWDYDNKLATSQGSGGSASVSYAYDALGRRVKQGSTVYVYGGSGQQNCIAEYHSGVASSSPIQEYVYGDVIDSLLMISRNNDTQQLNAIRNQQWSIVALVDSANGSIVERYTYDHFGARTILNPTATTALPTSAYSNPYGYTSRRHDASSLMYFRARMYDTSTGEFGSRDPLGYVDGMSLMRGYFAILAKDPRGLFSVESVIEILNSDPASRWVVCCLAARTVESFVSHSVLRVNSTTGKIKRVYFNGSYDPRSKNITIKENKSDIETASVLIQECMHARDREYPNFGSDTFEEMKREYDKSGLTELEKKKIFNAWSLRREIAGRIYEEKWRLRNNLGTKKHDDGSEVYENGARTFKSEGHATFFDVDEESIKNLVYKNYFHLLPENTAVGGDRWIDVERTLDWKGGKVLDQAKFKDACRCTQGPYGITTTPKKAWRGKIFTDGSFVDDSGKWRAGFGPK